MCARQHQRRPADSGAAIEFTTTMTTEQSITEEDTTELMTTAATETAPQTTGNTVTSSSIGLGFYFLCANAVIGVVGTVANGLVLYAMVASKHHKKQLLIFNQNLLDLVSCLFLGVTYGARIRNTYLELSLIHI